MTNIITHLLSDALQSPKVAVSVSTVTTGSGIATFLDLIPSNIGNFATVIGIILSLVLIVTHILKSFRDHERHKLEMKALKRAVADSRRRHGMKERETDNVIDNNNHS